MSKIEKCINVLKNGDFTPYHKILNINDIKKFLGRLKIEDVVNYDTKLLNFFKSERVKTDIKRNITPKSFRKNFNKHVSYITQKKIY